MNGVEGWGNALMTAVMREADPQRFARGEDLYVEGAVIEWHVEPGGLYGFIEGRSSEYSCTLRVEPLRDDHLALLLTFIRHLPQDQVSRGFLDVLDRALAARQVTLGPTSAPEPRCQCPDWGDYCKHSVALAFAVADAIDASPWVWLHARGLEPGAGVSAVAEREPTLDDELATYWSGAVEPGVVPELPRPADRERDRDTLVTALRTAFGRSSGRRAEEAATEFEELYRELVAPAGTVPPQSGSSQLRG